MAHKSRILIIDHHDSFTFNLVQLLETCGVETVSIVFHDSLAEVSSLDFDGILLSPGPGLPVDYPETLRIIREQGPHIPIFGVCLGHQAVVACYGGALKRLKEVNHGKSTPLSILHPEDPLFQGVSDGEPVGLYHSWVADPRRIPSCLEITAMSAEGNVLSVRHIGYDVVGVQFHPESIMTPSGCLIMQNWIHAKR